MAAPAPPTETSKRHHSYSRKDKSLGRLSTNFLALYNRDDVTSIGLDDAASRLGTERRRIYDIVNVMESIGVLTRKAKNKYSWKGFGAIPYALQLLKEEGLKENCNKCEGNEYSYNEDDEERCGSQQLDKCNTTCTLTHSANPKPENKREKSLSLLSQNFVKLFVCSNTETISLDDAAKSLLGVEDVHNATVHASKVRRIYDIVNVLASMNLIEKTQTYYSRRPAFKWLGVRGKEETLVPEEPWKRAFGADITNISSKRGKVDRSNSEDSKDGSKCFQFGPFAPATIARPGISNINSNMRRIVTSTYRPQYQNQALKDLFSHYTEAWKLWYSEVSGKNPIQIS